ncbi:hypothetical protein ScPMuIL_003766 [Solemya velum]
MQSVLSSGPAVRVVKTAPRSPYSVTPAFPCFLMVDIKGYCVSMPFTCFQCFQEEMGTSYSFTAVILRLKLVSSNPIFLEKRQLNDADSYGDKDSLDHNDVKMEQPSQYDEQEASMSFYNEQFANGRAVDKTSEYLNAALDHHEDYKQHHENIPHPIPDRDLTVVGGTVNSSQVDASFMEGLQTTEI